MYSSSSNLNTIESKIGWREWRWFKILSHSRNAHPCSHIHSRPLPSSATGKQNSTLLFEAALGWTKEFCCCCCCCCCYIFCSNAAQPTSREKNKKPSFTDTSTNTTPSARELNECVLMMRTYVAVGAVGVGVWRRKRKRTRRSDADRRQKKKRKSFFNDPYFFREGEILLVNYQRIWGSFVFFFGGVSNVEVQKKNNRSPKQRPPALAGGVGNL